MKERITTNTIKQEADKGYVLCSFRAFILFLVLFTTSVLQAQQTERLYLSGTGNDNTVNWEFFCTGGMNANKWTTIPVPSCWELQGFGKYDYGFAKDSSRGKEKGLYKYKFTVPKSWDNKLVSIVFEGSMTDTEVKVNGHSAGRTHQGAFYSFSYNVTDLLLVEGENLLEVTVSKHSANQSVNAAERRGDFWIFGGIFRPVYLEAFPDDHIVRVAIDARANGDFYTKVFTTGQADKVSIQLYTSQGIKFGAPIIEIIDRHNISDVSGKFSSPALWNPESPNLYKAVFTLYKKDKIVHQFSQKFGFRTVQVKERDGVYVNDVKVKMKGVNRHSFWPTSGRTTSKKLSIEDVLLMKDMNMNAVRMSHYPPDDHFLDACDSLGLFVMDELAGWHGHYDTETGSILLKEMITHDINHPSIIFWSNGNEGGHNLELDSLFTQLDIQQRDVLHPWQLFGGIETQHYREYNYGIGNYDHGHDIVMPTEFLHGLYDGGHGAGLEDYWEAMWKNPLSAGGFLWDFADEGVVRKDKKDSIDTDGNHGADGIIGPFHEKEGSYFAIKEIWSPIHIDHKEITMMFDRKLNIENRFHFTNTKQCRFSWKLISFPQGKGSSPDTVEGTITSPDIQPGSKGVLDFALPKIWFVFDVLYVTAWDQYNREIFTWSFPITTPAETAGNLIDTSKKSHVNITEEAATYHVEANGVRIVIDKNSGLLKEVKRGDKTILFNNGPVLQEGENNFKNFSYKYNNDTLII
ncbi:MAG: glycoside hydrolase family 2 TIM barrel-domain containing protein, partial [Chitinophagaceae bacterium]